MNKHQAETNQIINIMKRYIQTYIEQPHIVFGNMPICPFASQARQDRKVSYAVYPFQPSKKLSQDSDLLELIRGFKGDRTQEVLMVIHPDQQAISLATMKDFMQGLNESIRPLGLIAFSGHPLDDFNVQNVFTRRDPYINFIVQDRKILETFSQILKSTAYYDHWTPENLESIQ